MSDRSWEMVVDNSTSYLTSRWRQLHVRCPQPAWTTATQRLTWNHRYTTFFFAWVYKRRL